MITTEQQEYAKEKIAWSPVDFTINQPCVDLLEKKPKGMSFQLEDKDLAIPKLALKQTLMNLNNKPCLAFRHSTYVRGGMYAASRW